MFRTNKIAIFIALAWINISLPLYAQTTQDKFEIDFQLREAERRAVISRTMGFTEEEAVEFWPQYDVYRFKAKQFQQRRLTMLRKISGSLVGMTDELANETVAGALQLELDQQQAKNEFVSSLKTLFSNARFFRYYQVETKIDAVFTHGWTQEIPLALTEEEAKLMEDQSIDNRVRNRVR